MQILEEVIALYQAGAVGPGLRAAAERLSAQQLRMASIDVLLLLDPLPLIRSFRSENLRSYPGRLARLRTFVESTEPLKALFSVSDRAELVFHDPDQGQALPRFRPA